MNISNRDLSLPCDMRRYHSKRTSYHQFLFMPFAALDRLHIPFAIRHQHKNGVVIDEFDTSMPKNLIALAAYLTLVICAPPPQANAAYRPRCWEPQPQLKPAVFAECRDIIRYISESPTLDPDAPYKFSSDPAQHPDVRLPAVWTRGHDNCDVGLQFSPGQSGYDRTTLKDIQAAALAAALNVRKGHASCFVIWTDWNELMLRSSVLSSHRT